MAVRFGVVAMLLLLLQLACDGQGMPLVGVTPRHQMQILGRAESCKSVSIPAKSTCAPGLVCNPNSGTCVPVGHHIKNHQLIYQKIPLMDSSLMNKLSIRRSIVVGEKLGYTPWP